MSTLPVPEIKDVVILTNGGFSRDYNAIYVNGRLDWADADCDDSYKEKLLELLLFMGNARIPNSVRVEEVPDEIAVRMGLSNSYPDTYAEYLEFDKWIKE